MCSSLSAAYDTEVSSVGANWMLLQLPTAVAVRRSRMQGLIHDIPTAQQLIDRIIAEAESIVRERFGGVVKVGR